MPLDTATTIVLDLMVDANDQPQILEIQSLKDSSVHGWKPNNITLEAVAENFISRRNYSVWPTPELLDFICDNKAAVSTFIYPLLSQNLPWQRTYAHIADNPPTRDIVERCPSEWIVIKIPKSSFGVFYAEASSADSALRFIDEKASKIDYLFSGFFSDGQGDVLQNIIVAEQCIVPAPLNIGAETSRPTVRCVATIVWDSGNCHVLPKVFIHGSYLKQSKPADASNIITPAHLKSNVRLYGRSSIPENYHLAIEAQIPATLANIVALCRRHQDDAAFRESAIIKKLSAPTIGMDHVATGDAAVALKYLRLLDRNGVSPSSGFIETFKTTACDLIMRAPFLAELALEDWQNVKLETLAKELLPKAPPSIHCVRSCKFSYFP
jgi:hypothetical protein